MKTVREYFIDKLGVNPGLTIVVLGLAPWGDDVESIGDTLETMPLNSGCGQHCRETIDDAARFLKRITDAFGDDQPRLIRDTLYVTGRVCCCYITG